MRTIKKIALLRDFPVFNDFSPADDLPQLRKYNLIYGFNGSGKTTISRVLASLQEGVIDEHLPQGAKFSIQLDDGETITQAEHLAALKNRVFVFNEDFISRCLRWHEGTADPVFYIGRGQAELSRKLEAAEVALEKLRSELVGKEAAFEQAQRVCSNFNRAQASTIAEAVGLGRRYTATNLNSDYANEAFGDSQMLPDGERVALKRLIAEDAPLPKIPLPVVPDSKLAALVGSSVKILGTTVGEVVVKDLKDHPRMLNWVREGFTYHEEHELENCLLCGNELGNERRKELQSLIDDRFNELVRSIVEATDEVNFKINHLQEFSAGLPVAEQITQSLRKPYVAAALHVRELVEQGVAVLGGVAKKLQEKSRAPTTQIGLSDLLSIDELVAWQNRFNDAAQKIRSLIEAHTQAHDDFAATQQRARDQLRRHFLAEGQSEYAHNYHALRDAEAALASVARKLSETVEEVEELKLQVRQHGPAAEIINSLLKAYLGHDELTISVRDGDEAGYEIRRRGVRVKGTLCQGERTALSLCYFLSVLEAENRSLKDLIVVIDDPVSSLDTRALNYAFTLIKSSLANAAQLILLTHNLPFMNEVKKWLRNRSKQEPPTAAMWLIDSSVDEHLGTRQSKIVPLPKLLRDYDSEYHYVFSLALDFSTEGGSLDAYFYMMPNILRKVLEIFLAFKYPGPDGLGSKVEAVALSDSGIDPARIRAIERLVQVESHADSLEDLISLSSMTIEEVRDAADSLLVVMQALDQDHFARLKAKCS